MHLPSNYHHFFLACFVLICSVRMLLYYDALWMAHTHFEENCTFQFSFGRRMGGLRWQLVPDIYLGSLLPVSAIPQRSVWMPFESGQIPCHEPQPGAGMQLADDTMP